MGEPISLNEDYLQEDEEFSPVGTMEIHNGAGSYEQITLQTPRVSLCFPEAGRIREDLCLIYGIGETTATKLHQTGVTRIDDLVNHPRWGKAARELLRVIATGDIERLASYGASDLELLSFYRPEELCFVDIETTGLYYVQPVFLIGLLRFNNNHCNITQILARSFDEEKAILTAALTELKAASLIASFNGRSFDLPYLKGRMRYHCMEHEWQNFHLDLLRPARRSYRKMLPDCRLLTLEREILNEDRGDDLPGSMVAEYYHRFLDTGDRGWVEPILRHNAHDLLSMVKLLGLFTSRREA